MKVLKNNFIARLKEFSTRLRAKPLPRVPYAGNNAALLQAELFSQNSLEDLAHNLAREHKLSYEAGSVRFIRTSLNSYVQLLQETYRVIAHRAILEQELIPAGEWLLDNFLLIMEQIREIKEDLPPGYYHRLPKLKDSPGKPIPRVQSLAREYISHSGGRVEADHLISFVLAYEKDSDLSMAEIWALPIMLRLELIEYLVSWAARLLDQYYQLAEVEKIAKELAEETETSALAALLDGYCAQNKVPEVSPVFLLELFRLLQNFEKNPEEALAYLETLIEQRFGAVEDLIRTVNQESVTIVTAIANSITSMRAISSIDWEDWFERVSRVEIILRLDPAGVYGRCDFTTRDRYRHYIERLARQSNFSEVGVAWKLINQARAGLTGTQPALRQGHIGYYLEGNGRAELKKALEYHPGIWERIEQTVLKHPAPVYLTATTGLTIGLLAAGIKIARIKASPKNYLGFGLLALPGYDVAQQIVNWGVTKLFKPRVLPRLDFHAGIPDEYRTIVVVPMLLLTKESVERQFENLEVQWLANRDPNLHFALLSDFCDAPQKNMPEDQPLLKATLTRLKELQTNYGPDRFLFFHRERQWNPCQQVFMGWERKRGKLEEFNRLLAGATDTSFDVQLGDLSILPGIRYVITLDSDTQLPNDTARQLIGTMAHPLNQAVIDKNTRCVVEGYGILQPRVAMEPGSTLKSHFARIFGGHTGIDPYTAAISDVYMDLFGEGIYAGKGIYDPAVLREVLGGRFPPNTLLSHDLLEGCFARAGYVDNLQLIDNFPPDYRVYTGRLHRWIRGDWQLLPWLGSRLPVPGGGEGRGERNPLSFMARYKIADNLRRSLNDPAILVLLLGSWLVLDWAPVVFAGIALSPLLWPALISLIDALITAYRSPHPVATFKGKIYHFYYTLARSGINLALLLDLSLVSLNAIIKTLYRLNISHKRLLEWVSSDQAKANARLRPANLLGNLLPRASIFVFSGLIALAAFRHLRTGLQVTLVTLANWVSSPALVAWLERPVIGPPRPVEPAAREMLNRLAREYWEYFNTFVTAENHYLIPDNYQQDLGLVANRTSPTNIGLQLMADLSALDFGFTGLVEFADRVERVLNTLDALEHFRGHILNWYDTATLQPLNPAYVSTVDSGNLAGYLITLHQGIQQLLERPIIGETTWNGLEITLRLVKRDWPQDRALPTGIDEWLTRLQNPPETLDQYLIGLNELTRWAENLAVQPFANRWAGRLREQICSFRKDLETFLPVEQLSNNGQTNLQGALLAAKPPRLRDLSLAGPEATSEPVEFLSRVWAGQAQEKAHSFENRLSILSSRALEQALRMDFLFLYDQKRHLFHIGFQVGESRLDNSYYDLLASEARLSSIVAIAKGDVPAEHWQHLIRNLVWIGAGTKATLLSWSGTMFEYLMPPLIMASSPGSLLGDAEEIAVEAQIRYGTEHDIPWGISESAYYSFDVNGIYQYRAFGLRDVSIRRELGNELVIAPYATLLALPVKPAATLENISNLISLGAEADFGLYEAIDFNKERLPVGADKAIILSFMAHHQGMSLVAINNFLNKKVMQQRFQAYPPIQATALLTKEQFPRSAPRVRVPLTGREQIITPPEPNLTTREFNSAFTPVPYSRFLSNGVYSTVVTTAGGGYSRYNKLAVTRWVADSTCDNQGSFFYIQDVHSKLVWSPTYHPTRKLYETRMVNSLYKIEFSQSVAGLDSSLEITVSPEDNAEVRLITLHNPSSAIREIDVTSYSEIALAPPAEDEAHPAFSKLFIQTEYLEDWSALLATRRVRSPGQSPVWAVQIVTSSGHRFGPTEYETNRATFIGRGGNLAEPAALSRSLTNECGPVLDPIFSLRRHLRIAPGATIHLAFTTAMAGTREQAVKLAEKYHDYLSVARAFEMARYQTLTELHNLRVSADEIHSFQKLVSHTLYLDPTLRSSGEVIAANSRGQSSLWAYGISGDYPIVLAFIANPDQVNLAQELFKAHAYWRLKGFLIDLVIINEQDTGYTQPLQDRLYNAVRESRSENWLNRPGGIFFLRSPNLPEPDLVLLKTVARAVFYGNRGGIIPQLRTLIPLEYKAAPLALPELVAQQPTPPAPLTPLPYELQLAGEFGGFTPDGQEYVIEVRPGQPAPAPWVNVIANEQAGFLVTERGGGYSWAENSRENRLTPWSNDPVCDPPGEALYIRDEQSKLVWSPTPQPCGAGPYRVRHGFGYTVFENTSQELETRLTLYVPPTDPVKIYRLDLNNLTDDRKLLSFTLYLEWVLGVFREKMAPYIVTEFDAGKGLLTARNSYNNEFSPRIAFLMADTTEVSASGDRTEFIGRNNTLASPAALAPDRQTLSGEVGALKDPCGAVRRELELEAHSRATIFFILGEGSDPAQVAELVGKYRAAGVVEAAFTAIKQQWQEWLGSIRVTTPQPHMDVLLNGWLLYQTMACRMLARSAFYQSGGAYGFRDQLQDSMALVYSHPNLTREHLLRAAARQFVEGDVQHWWHPPTGRGVRTRISDDCLWLVFVTCFYVKTTGDSQVLDEIIPFLKGRVLDPSEDEIYDSAPLEASEQGSLYEHCRRAIEYGLRFGSHGLPLMGTGDWNDGLNLVGKEGRGESVWLGWFLYVNLKEWTHLAEIKGNQEQAGYYSQQAVTLLANLETSAWDGEWYLRAFFDDGTPLGSSQNSEGTIDSLAQSWAVIAGDANPARTAQALEAVWEHLVDPRHQLIRLLTPPFDKAEPNPGYIRGYVPGIRENGGQYTHGAIWYIWALALAGKTDQAFELFDYLNPALHSNANPALYKVEPYVIVADIYSEAPHAGRGGWSWYSGSAAWAYRLGVELLLGLHKEKDYLTLKPNFPSGWPGYSICYKYGQTAYSIKVERVIKGQPERECPGVELDGKPCPDGKIPLVDDGLVHQVLVRVV